MFATHLFNHLSDRGDPFIPATTVSMRDRLLDNSNSIFEYTPAPVLTFGGMAYGTSIDADSPMVLVVWYVTIVRERVFGSSLFLYTKIFYVTVYTSCGM